MGLKEERRINENESVWEEAKGKRGEGCVMGGWYGYGNYHILLFQGVGRVFNIENMDNYRPVLSVMKRHFHRRTNQTKALTKWQ
jgi:hypothetical protein